MLGDNAVCLVIVLQAGQQCCMVSKSAACLVESACSMNLSVKVFMLWKLKANADQALSCVVLLNVKKRVNIARTQLYAAGTVTEHTAWSRGANVQFKAQGLWKWKNV